MKEHFEKPDNDKGKEPEFKFIVKSTTGVSLFNRSLTEEEVQAIYNGLDPAEVNGYVHSSTHAVDIPAKAPTIEETIESNAAAYAIHLIEEIRRAGAQVEMMNVYADSLEVEGNHDRFHDSYLRATSGLTNLWMKIEDTEMERKK